MDSDYKNLSSFLNLIRTRDTVRLIFMFEDMTIKNIMLLFKLLDINLSLICSSEAGIRSHII